MTDFFSRLAERALGIALTIQPRVAPRYAPEPQEAEDSVLDVLANERKQEQAIQNTPLTMPLPHTQHIQAPVILPQIQHLQSPVALPETQHAQSSVSSLKMSEQPALGDKTALPLDTSLTPGRETQTILQPYAVLQRAAQPHPTLPEEHMHIMTTQNTYNTNNNMHTTVYPTLPKTLPQPIEQHHEHIEIHAPSLPKQSEQRLTLTDPLSSIDQREAPIPVTHTIYKSQDAIGNGASGQPSSKQFEHYERHIQHEQTIKERYTTPTIQVTIGRIEVRATTTSTPNAQPQRQQGAPPVMSLDDYLHRRAKGER